LLIVQNPRFYNPLGKVIAIFCLLGILLTCAAAVMVIYFKDHIVIKAARYHTVVGYQTLVLTLTSMDSTLPDIHIFLL